MKEATVNVHSVDTNAQSATDLFDHLPELGTVPGLVWAFRIHEDGKADTLPVDQPIEGRHEGWIWLHVDLANQQTSRWLAASGLPPAAIATMLSRDRHQQLHTTSTYIHGILADLEGGIGGVGEGIGHLRFVMTDRLLISGRHRDLASVETVRTRIESGRHRLSHVASLLELIVEQVADGIDQIVDELATELDGIENALADRSTGVERSKLARMRHAAVRLHRQLAGLRAVFHRLERKGSEGIKPGLQLAASKLAQRLDDLDHGVLELRERGHRLQEEASSLMAEETNRHLHVLSIVTTLLLPPTLVTGIFGMNIKGLPFIENEAGLLWTMGLVLMSSLAVYVVMRRVGIFKS
ncbi:MAG: CorA family divalent cation transporter [Hyphomicrobiales bacterium]